MILAASEDPALDGEMRLKDLPIFQLLKAFKLQQYAKVSRYSCRGCPLQDLNSNLNVEVTPDGLWRGPIQASFADSKAERGFS